MDFPSQINELPLLFWQGAPKCDFKSEYKVTNINNTQKIKQQLLHAKIFGTAHVYKSVNVWSANFTVIGKDQRLSRQGTGHNYGSYGVLK